MLRHLFIVCLVGLVLAPAPKFVFAESWTSLDGSRTVQGSMVGMWDNNVILILSTGRRVTVPMNGLIAESRIQAEEIDARLTQQRAELRAELNKASGATEEPAPDPLPTPPSTIASEPLPPETPAREAVQQIERQLMGGRFAVLFTSLPPTYQDKVEAFVDLSLQKTDANEHNASIKLMHRIADLVVTRQNWIASHPFLAGGSTDGTSPRVEIFRTLVVPIAAMIRDGMPPDQMEPSVIINASFGNWLRKREEAMAPHLAQIMRRYAEKGRSWEIDNIDGSTATMTWRPINASGSAGQTITLKNVEGYWIPQSVAEGFIGFVDVQMDMLNKFEDGKMNSASFNAMFTPAIGGGPAAPAAPTMNVAIIAQGFNALLDPLEQATDAASFHQAVDQMVNGFSSMAAMFGGGPGGPGGGPGGPGGFGG